MYFIIWCSFNFSLKEPTPFETETLWKSGKSDFSGTSTPEKL
jgi:hypothetical protein